MAITWIGGWALVVEDLNGYISPGPVLAKLSKGTRLVGVYSNTGPDGQFILVEDGVVKVDFPPGGAAQRTGTQPDRLLADMRAAGWSAEQLNSTDPNYRYVNDYAAAMALAERVVGVALTAELLHSSRYLAVAVPDTGGGAVNEEPEVRTVGP